jgi:predicted ATPase/class 3 adenylate cyclase
VRSEVRDTRKALLDHADRETHGDERPPAAPVALVFTDVEGSTKLADSLGDAWPAVLDTHRQLVRSAVAANGGREIDSAGDGFFFVFEGAQGIAAAAAAAGEAQRSIAGHCWPEGAELRVRIGLHSGVPHRSENGYVGLDVHKAARVADAANGGQVLCSEEARDLLRGHTLHDLGYFRLKDLTAAERLFQLVVDGVPLDSRPPRSLNATNLPMQPSRLIGRRGDLGRAVGLIEAGGARLVTFTGPGGIGKTRLALEVAAALAHRFANAVYWVPLATVEDPAHVEGTIAAMIGAPTESEGLVRFLRERTLLLVADNFEHVLAAAPLIANLLQEARGLTVIATSRAPLHLSTEIEVPVGELGDLEAVELFAERAEAVAPGFASSSRTFEICRRLDGIPLALELAAARLRHFGEETLLTRIDRSLDLLTGGPADLPERQRTLRGVIAWSYELLGPDERRLLNRLSVFAGRATFELAERVCGGGGIDVLGGISLLVEQNLLRFFAAPGGEGEHYFMLESVRAFALERLAASGEEEAIRRRHRDAFLELAESLDPMTSMNGIRALGPERANLRAALRFSLDSEPTDEATLRLAYVLWRYFLENGSITEGRAWLDDALERAELRPSFLRARALDAASLLAAQRGEFEHSLELNTEAHGVAETLDDNGFALGWIYSRRGQILIDVGNLDEAERALERASELLVGVPRARAWALIELGRIAILSLDNETALQRFRAAETEAERAADPVAAAYARTMVGCALAFAGNEEPGLAAIEAGIEHLRSEAAHFTLTIALLHAAPAYRLAGLRARERSAVAEAVQLALDSGVIPRAGACFEAAARIAVDDGRPADAARMWGAADRIVAESGVLQSPLRRRLRAKYEERVRGSLGEAALSREQERGAAFGLTEALEAAAAIAAESAVAPLPA